MNKLLKSISIIMLIMLIVCQYTLVSKAANEVKTVISLKTDETTIAPKDEIKVCVYIESLKLTDGIMYAEGILDYEKDVLEPIITNGSTYNDWTIGWNQETGKLTADRISLVKEKQEIAEITFKVKENVSLDDVKETEIKLKDIVVNDLDGEDSAEDAVLKLELSETTEDEDKKDDNKEDEDKKDDGKEDDSKEDEDKKDDSKEDEDKKDDSKEDEDKKDDSKEDEDKKDDSKEDEDKKDDSKEDEDKKDDSKEDEDKKDDSKEDEDKKDDSKSEDGSSNKDSSKTNTDSEKNTANKTDTTTKKGKIPYTGAVEWIVLTIIAVVTVGFISYKKYQKYKNV